MYSCVIIQKIVANSSTAGIICLIIWEYTLKRNLLSVMLKVAGEGSLRKVTETNT